MNIKFKIILLIYWLRLQYYVKRFIHCKYNYHQFYPVNVSVTNSKQQLLEVKYFRCNVCNTLFFNNTDDKKIYKRIKDKENSCLQNMFKNMWKKD